MTQHTINYFKLNDIPLCDESMSEIAERYNPDTEIAMVKVADIIAEISDTEDKEYLEAKKKALGNFWVELG